MFVLQKSQFLFCLRFRFLDITVSEGGHLHRGAQCRSFLQEACLAVCSTQATTYDLRRNQVVLRLQALPVSAV